MKDDIRYSEFLFLRDIARNPLKYFNPNDQKAQKDLGLNQVMYVEMVIALLEDLYVQFDRDDFQLLVWQLRGEVSSGEAPSVNSPRSYVAAMRHGGSPRTELFNRLLNQNLQQLRITYRGLRRIEELRDLLKRDRVLEDFGVLLSLRYFTRDLEDALRRGTDDPVSVLYIDMDKFKEINTRFGHAAGDIVMNNYLEIVRDCLGSFGTGYRGSGDEVVALIIGQGHQRANEIAERIRKSIEVCSCKYNETQLPPVTASIGLATTPPAPRSMEIEVLAEARNRQAKDESRNRVVGS